MSTSTIEAPQAPAACQLRLAEEEANAQVVVVAAVLNLMHIQGLLCLLRSCRLPGSFGPRPRAKIFNSLRSMTHEN